MGYTHVKDVSYLTDVPYMDLQDIDRMEVNFRHAACPSLSENFSFCYQLDLGPCNVNGTLYVMCES